MKQLLNRYRIASEEERAALAELETRYERTTEDNEQDINEQEGK